MSESLSSPLAPCSRLFGILPDGREVEAWTLRGAGGLELEVLSYGGIVSRLLIPARDGCMADVVLGFHHLEGYFAGHPYFGATVGRVAGRISRGKFSLEGRNYQLLINDPPNHLHGGRDSIDKQLWTAEPVERADGHPSLRLSITSPEGENGYPGSVDLAVTYTVTGDNAFIFETEARSTCATPVNLTHHSYFNLAGEGAGNVLDHHLQIDSDHIFSADEKMTLLDELRSLDGQAADFRNEQRLGTAISGIWQQHGDLYWLRESKECRPVAQLRHPGSGRILSVATSNPCMQMYAGGGLDGSLIGKSGKPYPTFGGLCLECQGSPNAIGDGAGRGFGDIVVRPETPQRHATIYQFSTAT
jgi:aldose 1-epimerase